MFIYLFIGVEFLKILGNCSRMLRKAFYDTATDSLHYFDNKRAEKIYPTFKFLYSVVSECICWGDVLYYAGL